MGRQCIKQEESAVWALNVLLPVGIYSTSVSAMRLLPWKQQKQAEGQEKRSKSEEEAAEAEVMQQLADARSRLLGLGPCPKPMMG